MGRGGYWLQCSNHGDGPWQPAIWEGRERDGRPGSVHAMEQQSGRHWNPDCQGQTPQPDGRVSTLQPHTDITCRYNLALAIAVVPNNTISINMFQGPYIG